MTEPTTPLARRLAVDRASPVPLYFQVAQRLEKEIESGELSPGARLDNEVVLADQLGLSRPTMRQAIQYLVDKGLLVRKRGVGTQVVQARVTRPIQLTSLYDDLSKAEQRPTTRVLRNTVEPADEAVAQALGLPEGTPVVALDRLRFAGGEPLARLRNHLPTGLAELTTDALEERGLYELLRTSGIGLRVATQRIGSRAARAAEARLLGESRRAPLLTMERTAYDDAGRAVEFGSHVYRASRYSFQVTLVDR